MCMSRLHRVLGADGPGAVQVEDIDGGVHRASLLALPGPVPLPGEWLVVHSGYALERVEKGEAEAIAAQVRETARAAGEERAGPGGTP